MGNFNKIFGERELTDSQFKEANRILRAIEIREKNLIKERNDLKKALRSKKAEKLNKKSIKWLESKGIDVKTMRGKG